LIDIFFNFINNSFFYLPCVLGTCLQPPTVPAFFSPASAQQQAAVAATAAAPPSYDDGDQSV
jgi:hypothetical protein